VYDVATGNLEFTRDFSGPKRYYSQYSVYEEAGKNYAKLLLEFYAGR
jgi:hypothetical protein